MVSLHDRMKRAVDKALEDRSIHYGEDELLDMAFEIADEDNNKLKLALREIREIVTDDRATRCKIQEICDAALKEED